MSLRTRLWGRLGGALSVGLLLVGPAGPGPAVAAPEMVPVEGVLEKVTPQFVGRDIHVVVQALSLPDLKVVAQTPPLQEAGWELRVPVGPQYQVRVQTDDDWVISTPQTISVPHGPGGTTAFDVQAIALDAGLHGVLQGDGLGAEVFKHTSISTWYPRGGHLYPVQPDGRYGLYDDAPTTTWDKVLIIAGGQAPHEGRVDIRSPLAVSEPRGRLNWTLPSLALSNVSCVAPGTCSFSVDGSGWVPGAPVNFYLVEFGRADRGGQPLINTPDMMATYDVALITSAPADDSGHLAGDLSGTLPQPWPLFERDNGAWSIEAVQLAGAEFKAVHTADAFDYPPPAQITINLDDPNAPQVEFTGS